MKKKFLLPIILLISIYSIQSAPQRDLEYVVRFSHLSIESGLSQNTVRSIFKDKKGFMWFGTQGGLNRYDGYEFKIYTHKPGITTSLSNNLIYAITDDGAGKLWIGTENGLNRFDPNTETFKRYGFRPGNPNTISNNEIRALLRDKKGNLWIGTLGGGLNCLNLQTETFTIYKNNPRNPHSLSFDAVNALLEDRQGFIWIATQGGGLNRLDPATGFFTRFQHIPGNPQSIGGNDIPCLALDEFDNLWIGSWESGLTRFNRAQGTFKTFVTEPGNATSISHNSILSILPGWKGHLWIGTIDGLNLFDPVSERFLHYYMDPNEPNSLSNSCILSLYGVECGDVWVGTAVGGVNLINCDRKEFISYRHEVDNPNSLSNNNIYAFYEDRGNANIVWIGTRGGGLNRLDRSTGMFKAYRHDAKNRDTLGHDEVHALLQDHSGTLWVGTLGQGLYKFIEKEERFIPFKKNANIPNSISGDYISCIYEDSANVLWIGTMDGGLNKMDKTSGTFIHYMANQAIKNSLSSSFIRTIDEDKTGDLWIGTANGGLNHLDRKTGRFTCYRNHPENPNSLSYNTVLSFLEDSSGIFWIGTEGSGLNRFNRKNKTFTVFTDQNGLPDNTIYAILEDKKGFLWLSTNRGLAKFNPLNKTVRIYDTQDGLQSNEFNFGAGYKNKRGEMFFGGVNGFNTFYPDRILDNPIIPPVVITDLKIFNQSVPIGEGENKRVILSKSIMNTQAITLSYLDGVITFEYSALNFELASKNRYAYIMEGFEKRWNEVGTRRFATYTNLPPGTYYFKVKGSNNDGIWNEAGSSLKITVTPPLWQTWWFTPLLIMLTLSLILFLYKWQMGKERNLSRRLEEEVVRRTKEAEQARQTAEEANKSKSQFLARMSHEIRTPLNGVLGFIPMLLDTELSPAQLDYVKSINIGGKALLTLVNDILDFSKIEAGLMTLEYVDFNPAVIAAEVCNMTRPRLEGKDVKISCFLSPQVPTVIQSDPSRFRQVLLNLMGNAAKFTAHGEIELAITVIKENEKQLKLQTTIQDTGIGIPGDKLESIFDVFQQADGSTTRHYGGSGLGLTICRQVALLMEGKVWAESELGKGSIFHFTAWVNRAQNPVPITNEITEINESKEINENKKINKNDEIDGSETNKESIVKTIAARPQEAHTDTGENKIRILLVEDNALNQKLACYILRHAGYYTELATNGKEAVDIIIARPDYFHLVLMDVQMPVMDGLEATRMLREKGFTDIPILAMTAQALKGDKEKCLEMGMNDFITKPIKREEIYRIVQKWTTPQS